MRCGLAGQRGHENFDRFIGNGVGRWVAAVKEPAIVPKSCIRAANSLYLKSCGLEFLSHRWVAYILRMF